MIDVDINIIDRISTSRFYYAHINWAWRLFTFNNVTYN